MDRQVQRRIEEMRSSLSNMGVSITRRRAKTLEVLASTDSHPSVNEIHAEVRRWYPTTSLATIYNTIEILKDAGAILELEFSGAANRYDGRRPYSHPHLICIECGAIEDLNIDGRDLDRRDRLTSLSGLTGYELVRERTDYYGVCPGCRRVDGSRDDDARRAETATNGAHGTDSDGAAKILNITSAT